MSLAAPPAENTFPFPSGNRGSRILYLTFDGVMDPLGHSQVLNYLIGLAERGFAYTIVSLESQSNLSHHAAFQQTLELLRRSSIEWQPLPYRTGGPIKNIRSMARSAGRIIRSRGVGLVHARSYTAAFVAWMLRFRYGTQYLFDVRGYWIDEKVAEGQWFTNARVYALAKRLERLLFRSAAGIVTLTGVMADDLRAGLLKDKPKIPVVVIPTCADFDRFRMDSLPSSAVSPELQQRFEGKLIIGMLGSVNASYCVQESLQLFSMLKGRREDAHLVWVTRQVEQARALVGKAGISENDFTIVTSSFEDVPDWIRIMDWGLLLLNETFSKRGSMPTKLAEMFACGVRPIQYGCNQEVRDRVLQSGSGVVLDDLSAAGMERAVEHIATTALSTEEVKRVREQTRAWFGLENGIDRYDKLLRQLLAGSYPDSMAEFFEDSSKPR
jgi:glycosyltransferase involved in cell wall biosynthesis